MCYNARKKKTMSWCKGDPMRDREAARGKNYKTESWKGVKF